MKKRLNRYICKIKKYNHLRIPIGISFLVIGFIGGFIPIFQGWVFVLLGLTLLFGKKFTSHIKRIKKGFRK